MGKSLRPPTKIMIEKLKECLDKQPLDKGEISYLAGEMKSSMPGLYKRGFIGTKMQVINKKKLLCIYITEAGKNFLLMLNMEKENKA